jgi:hypothetical protein
MSDANFTLVELEDAREIFFEHLKIAGATDGCSSTVKSELIRISVYQHWISDKPINKDGLLRGSRRFLKPLRFDGNSQRVLDSQKSMSEVDVREDVDALIGIGDILEGSDGKLYPAPSRLVCIDPEEPYSFLISGLPSSKLSEQNGPIAQFGRVRVVESSVDSASNQTWAEITRYLDGFDDYAESLTKSIMERDSLSATSTDLEGLELYTPSGSQKRWYPYDETDVEVAELNIVRQRNEITTQYIYYVVSSNSHHAHKVIGISVEEYRTLVAYLDKKRLRVLQPELLKVGGIVYLTFHRLPPKPLLFFLNTLSTYRNQNSSMTFAVPERFLSLYARQLEKIGIQVS